MKHSGKKAGIILLAALIALGATVWLLYRGVFVTRNVVIEGRISGGSDEIIRAAALDMGGSIFAVDEDVIRSHLESSGRYALDGVEIRYPGTVALSVRERTRDAMVSVGGRILMLDSDGYVVEICTSVPENAGIYVQGLGCTSNELGRRVGASQERLDAMKTVLEAIRQQNAGSYFSELNVSDPLKLWMVSRTGLRVELGDGQNMSDKLLWACSAVADLEMRGETRGTLDVSSGNMADFRPQG